MTPSVSTPVSGRRHLSPFDSGKKIVDGDRFVAVGARSTHADPGHEDAAVVAPLVANLALATLRAFVDGGRPARLARGQGRRLQAGLVAATEAGLAAGVGG